MMDNNRYTPDEIFEIFKEQHRICCPLDIFADETFVLQRETEIWEWRDAQDLVEWEPLSKFLNKEFRIQGTIREWYFVLNPDNQRTIGDVCDFIAARAKKDVYRPTKLFGRECLKAAVFITLKRNLKNKGADVSNLRPSTSIEEFLSVSKNFSPLIEEATLTGTKTFDQITLGPLTLERKISFWFDKYFPRYRIKRPINTGELKTFRDLVEKIVEGVKLG